jgi:hypothetical protein
MVWFITAIEIIAQGEGPSHYGEKLVRKAKSKRCFGFYLSDEEARRAIERNYGEMHEALYYYLVLEMMLPGIHPQVHQESWYEWDSDQRRWVPSVKPDEFVGIVNWAVG